MLYAIKSVLADVSSISPSSEELELPEEHEFSLNCSDEGLKLETSVSILFTAYSISTSTLRWYTVRFTTMPTQTKTSSHRNLKFN